MDYYHHYNSDDYWEFYSYDSYDYQYENDESSDDIDDVDDIHLESLFVTSTTQYTTPSPSQRSYPRIKNKTQTQPQRRLTHRQKTRFRHSTRRVRKLSGKRTFRKSFNSHKFTIPVSDISYNFDMIDSDVEWEHIKDWNNNYSDQVNNEAPEPDFYPGELKYLQGEYVFDESLFKSSAESDTESELNDFDETKELNKTKEILTKENNVLNDTNKPVIIEHYNIDFPPLDIDQYKTNIQKFAFTLCRLESDVIELRRENIFQKGRLKGLDMIIAVKNREIDNLISELAHCKSNLRHYNSELNKKSEELKSYNESQYSFQNQINKLLDKNDKLKRNNKNLNVDIQLKNLKNAALIIEIEKLQSNELYKALNHSLKLVESMKKLKNSPPPSSKHEIEKKYLCSVCLTSPINIMASPCNHVAYCSTCIKKLNHCALCKQYIDKTIPVFTQYE